MSSVVFMCQVAKPWLHYDIRSCSHLSVYAFTSKYDSTTYLITPFYTKGVLHEILYTKSNLSAKI